jgi:hypothetical protein
VAKQQERGDSLSRLVLVPVWHSRRDNYQMVAGGQRRGESSADRRTSSQKAPASPLVELAVSRYV